MISVLKAENKDLPILKQLSIETFRETFAAQNREDDLKNYLEDSFNEKVLSAQLSDPDSLFYFAVFGNEICGYLKINFSAAQTELKDPESLEIERIYVLKTFQDKKAGKAMMEKAIEVAAENALSYIWLGVWEKNEKAIAFYRKYGFAEFGRHAFLLGNDVQTDLLMRKYL